MVNINESITYLKNLSISPKKLRFYIENIKKLKPKKALDRLFYSNAKATKILYKAIKSAIENAKKTLKTDDNLLKFKALAVDEGIKLKRYKPGPRGIVRPILKRKSHIKIILTNSNEENNLFKNKINESKNENNNKKKSLKIKKTKNGSKS